MLFSGAVGGTRPWRSNNDYTHTHTHRIRFHRLNVAQNRVWNRFLTLISACVMRRLVGLCFTVAALKSSDGRALRTTSC